MFEIAVIVAVVIALTQLIKKLDLIPVKYLPAFSLILGIVAGYFYVDAPTISEKIMIGLMIGLSAAGLFDQSKIMTKK